MIYIANDNDASKRLDSLVADAFSISRSRAAKLIESGDVKLNGTACQKKHTISPGDTVELVMPEPEFSSAEPENIPLDIVYEDDDILVINKPSGLVVHPAPGNYSGTLVNALLYHCGSSLSGIGGVIRPGIVHRIDKDTSGLLVVAKNDEAHNALADELSYHGIVREYHALVRGGFANDTGTVDCPIARHPIDRKKMAAFPCGDGSAKEAITHYEVLRRYGEVSYLKLILETGRTHQIRVHMSYLGHPLIGDEVYASNKIRFEKLHAPLLHGQVLHAKKLVLTHPRTKERLSFECELPDDFKKLIEILENTNS